MKRVGARDLAECYRILNVAEGSAFNDVKKAYRTLAKKYHPDLNPDDPDTETHFKRINHAFEVLKNHYTLKRVWRSWEHRQRPQQTPVENAQTSPPPPQAEERPAVVPFPEVLKELFSQWGKRMQKSFEEYEKILFPLDVQTTVTVDAATASKGSTIKVQTGSEKFEVTVPLSSWNSFVLRVPEKGNSGLFNKKRGDLLVNIQVLPATQPASTKSQNYKIQIPRQSVQMGRVMTLHTQEGPIKFFLPKDVSDGQTFTLKAKPRSESSHLVTVHLV